MAESTEVQIARLDERLKMLLDKLEEDAEGHEKIQDFIVATNMALASISTRIQNVEASLSMNKPVIDEFITIKHKVVGAGTLGKWLWVAGAAILGYVASSRELIGNIIRGFQQ